MRNQRGRSWGASAGETDAGTNGEGLEHVAQQELGEDDMDVFGHGGSLDQEHGMEPGGCGPSDSPQRQGPQQQQAPGPPQSAPMDTVVVEVQDSGGQGSRCTIVKRATGDEPVRIRTVVWVSAERSRIEFRGEDGRTNNLGAIERLGEARREGPYAVVAERADIRWVFTSTGDADRFCHQMSQVRNEGSSKRASCPQTAAMDEGAEVEASRRAARARERIDNLRLRVMARTRAAADAGEDNAPRTGNPGELETAGPAPSTPIVLEDGAVTRGDSARIISTGCGCGGRLHEECARRVKPRLRIGQPAAADEVDSDRADRGLLETCSPARGGEAYQPTCTPPRDMRRCGASQAGLPPEQIGTADGESADQGALGLRAHPESRDHHPPHVHHRRAGARNCEGGEGCELRRDGVGEGAEEHHHYGHHQRVHRRGREQVEEET